MKRFIKIIIIAFLAIIILLFSLPFAFKGKIKELILKETNKNLEAKLEVGKISLSLFRSFPDMYVRLNDISITGQGAFEGDTMAYIQSLALSAGIFDLINGSPYQIKKVWIDQADVRLKILEDGLENWDILKSSDSETPEEEAAGEVSEFRLLLKSFVIKDSRLVYDDIRGKTYVVLDGLNHQLSGDLSEDFTTLETQTNVSKTLVSYYGVTYLNDAIIDWQADLDADLVHLVYTFKDNKLKINDFNLVFNGSAGMPDEGYDLDLTFETPDQSFKQLLSLFPAIYARDFASVSTEGKFSFEGFVKGLYTDDQYPAFLINLNVQDAWFRYPDLPSAVEDINLFARIENPGGDLDNTIIDMEKFTANFAGNPLMAELLLKNPVSDPYIDTRVDVKLNLSDVEKFYPLEEGESISGNITADFMLKGKLSDVENQRYNAFEASGIFQANGIQFATSYFAQKINIETANLKITPAFLELNELKVKAGRSDFNLKGKLENYLAYYLKDETLKGNFVLKSSLIDVNELLTYPDSPDAAIDDTSALSALIVPSGIDFSLSASANAVEYKNFDVRGFAGKVQIKDQQLILEDIIMNVLGGSIQMDGFYETTDPNNPLVDLSLGMKSISIQESFGTFVLIERLAPIAEKISGDFSGNFNMAGLLDSRMMPRLETLTGAAKLITSTLEVKNVNTLNQLSSSLKMDQFRELKIAGATVAVQFMDGVMDVKPFDFRTFGIEMNLSGQTSLDQRIGYVLKMKIPRSMMGGAANNVLNDLVAKAGQAGADFKLGEFVDVSALIEGTISDPTVKLNLMGTGKDIVQSVKEQVQQQVEQKVEEIEDKAREEAEEYLQEADRQAQAILDEAQRQSAALLNNAQKLADEAKEQANTQADNLIREAKGKGAVTELAAKKSADEIRKQGDKQAQNIITEARQKSDAMLDKARLEADQIKQDARKKINP